MNFENQAIRARTENWGSKIGTSETNNLSVKMESLSHGVRSAILVCINGISGNSYRVAQLRRRELRQKGRYILVLDRKDLQRVVNGETITEILEESMMSYSQSK